MSIPRRPWSTWIAVAVFLAAAATTIAFSCHKRTRPPQPATIAEMTHFLQASHPEWRAEPNLGDANMERSAYLLSLSFSMSRFPPSYAPTNRERWRGAVLIQMPRDVWLPVANEFGDCSLEIGPFVLYGDPAMIAEIDSLLRRSD